MYKLILLGCIHKPRSVLCSDTKTNDVSNYNTLRTGIKHHSKNRLQYTLSITFRIQYFTKVILHVMEYTSHTHISNTEKWVITMYDDY